MDRIGYNIHLKQFGRGGHRIEDLLINEQFDRTACSLYRLFTFLGALLVRMAIRHVLLHLERIDQYSPETRGSICWHMLNVPGQNGEAHGKLRPGGLLYALLLL